MLSKYKDYDLVLITTVGILCLFGLVMVYSSSYVLALDLYDNYTHFITRQLIYFIAGLMLFFVLMHINYRVYLKLSPYIIIVSIILLVLVLLIGSAANEAQRWLQIGPLTIQPSELVKLGTVIYLAQVYSKKQDYINRFGTGVAPPLIVVIVIFTLILLQPDLGTASAILLVTGIVVFLSGARWRHLILLGFSSGLVVWYMANIAEYRAQRLVAFRDPFEYASTSGGYQLVQSYISIAHGGLTGTGLGQSVQKLAYLPEPHTDFILAVISEELGWLGIGFLILCFVVIGIRGVLIGTRCRNVFGTLLALGIVFQLLTQFVFNAGAATGLLPITGITIPFVSYGGSSLLVSLASIAILANISRKNAIEKRNREEQDLPESEELSVQDTERKKA
ncbi:putative lipid II flippase FtsW [Salsuginibacillus kocurii]|uniref:putative lipid II flippase FtsW n=1 Tax=Salsuginibacillus kocurii TaxID=427078 RepID=UPI000364C87D|nr:putative lipid II flippase FtsW [Salsuginibacillus kocurii]